MSFYTSLVYYRPCPPPRVTADDLSHFIAKVQETNTLTDRGLRTMSIKFGESIDLDDRDTQWVEELPSGLYQTREIEWDVERFDRPSLQELIDCLSGDKRIIYRAFIMLGMPTQEVLERITRKDSPENEVDYCPDGLSIQLGPILCSTMATEQPLHMGWISVELSGGGYLFPWTFRDAYDRLESSAEIQKITRACQQFWPVKKDPPVPRIAEIREQFKTLWPYDEYDRPWDWFWGLRESG